MKVGLLTVHCSINAGASLQAYALSRILNKIGYEVEIINYRPSYFTDEMDEVKRKQKQPIKKRMAQLLWRNKLIKEHESYVKFEENYLPPKTMRYNSLEEIEMARLKYDIFICGSDQIWNPQHIKYDRTMLLSFVNHDRSITASFAASIGQDELNKDDIIFLKENIRHLDYISVREESAKELLQKIDPTLLVQRHIDPTLLLDEEEWAEIESSVYRDLPCEYAVYYPLADNPIAGKILKTIKETYNIQIVGLCRKVKKVPEVDIQIRNFSPEDFVSYIHHAKYVITNSFHGSVFSLIFHKRLVSYKNPIRNTRLECLFKLFNINMDQVDSDETIDKLTYIEPSEILFDEHILNKEKGAAVAYLSSFLRNDYE